MGVRASYPERERVCEPRESEFEAECHDRLTLWACVYGAPRAVSELVSGSMEAWALRQSHR